MLGGGGVRRQFSIKMVLSGAMWASQSMLLPNRKTNNFKVTKSTTKHNRHMFHSDQISDMHVM